MTHLPQVIAALEPGAGDIVPHLEFLLVSLPEFSNLPQWLVSFSGAIKGKGGYNEGAIG
jgi:hypothetical protein